MSETLGNQVKVHLILGARPNQMKVAPLFKSLESNTVFKPMVIDTGQHFDVNMSAIFQNEFQMPPPYAELKIGSGSHAIQTGKIMASYEELCGNEKPDWTIVFGDVNSTLACSLVAAKMNIPIVHAEAGLRSWDRTMPEEINRVLTDHSADLLFAPTGSAVTNLLAEGISGEKVHRVGDVMLDATIYYKHRASRPASASLKGDEPFVLCTVHRPENTDDPARLTGIVRILNQISASVPVILPLHPRTKAALDRLPGVLLNSSVQLIEPLGFMEMTWLLGHCLLVLTDSGGLQKEAYFHQKPCITLRNETEWTELVQAGYNYLLSPFATNVIKVFEQMIEIDIPTVNGFYGDGDAAKKIGLHIFGDDHKGES